MDSCYPDRPDSHQGGYPQGYPPDGFPNHPPSGYFSGLSGATTLVRLKGFARDWVLPSEVGFALCPCNFYPCASVFISGQ
jgi:hypothetical protein